MKALPYLPKEEMVARGRALEEISFAREDVSTPDTSRATSDGGTGTPAGEALDVGTILGVTGTPAGGTGTLACAPCPTTAPPSVAVLRLLRAAFSFPAFLGALLVAGAFLCVALTLRQDIPATPDAPSPSIFEGDTWMHLNVGERILATRTWRRTDSDSFTAAGCEWIDYEWLGDVVMAEVFRLGGQRGLAGLLLGAVGAFFLLVYYLAFLYSGSPKAAFIACAAMLPLVALCFTMRPQLFGYDFLVLTFVALERFRQGKRKMLWVLPLVFLLWVNIHSTFIFGLMAMVVYWACGLFGFRTGGLEMIPWRYRERLQLEITGLLSAVALTLTPYGTRLATIPIEFLNYPLGMKYIIEFQPLGVIKALFGFFIVLLLFFLVSEIVLHPSYRLEQIALLAVGVYFAAVHARFVVLFAAAFAPLLAALLARWLPAYEPGKDKRFLNAALMASILAAIIVFFPTRSQLRRMVEHRFPEGAVNYLRHHPAPGNLFNADDWGMYLVYRLGPQQKIFVDGRSQLYEGSGVYADYIHIINLDPDALALLARYNIRACLIPPRAMLATLLEAVPEWHQAYRDSQSVLFVRDSEGSREKEVGEHLDGAPAREGHEGSPLLARRAADGRQ